MEKKVLKRLTALGLASLLLSGTALSHTVHAEDNQPIAQFRVHKDGSQSIVGKTTPNTHLQIYEDGIIETVSDTEGNYEFKIPEDKKYNGSSTEYIYSVDNEGNSNTLGYVKIDLSTPYFSDELRINVGDDMLIVRAFDNNEMDTVSLKIGDKVYQGEKKSDNEWSFTFPFVLEGNTVTVTATDKAGNKTEETLTVSVLEAPTATHTVNYGDTNQFIKGQTYPNATVHVLLPNQKELTTTSNDNGEFNLELTEENWFYADEGEAQVWVVRQGGFSSPKKTVERNSWPIDSIYNGYEFRVKEDGSQLLKFDGNDYGNKKITVNLPNGETLSPVKDKDGNQQIMLLKDKVLKHNQLVTVQFKNNIGKWTYTIIPDVEAPAIPVVNEISAGDKVIGGTAEKDKGTNEVKDMMYNALGSVRNVTVLVTLPDGKIRMVSPDQYGNWILSIPTVKNGDIITVRAKDFIGNISEPRVIKVGSGEINSIHETGQANIQAELPEFPIKDVPEVDKPKENTPSTNTDGKTETKPSENKKEPTGTSTSSSVSKEDQVNTESSLPSYSLESVTKVNGAGNQSQQQSNVSGVETSNSTTKQASTDDGPVTSTKNSVKGQNNSQTTKKTGLPKTGERANPLALLVGFVIMGLSIFNLKGKKSN